mmetsp:Transcript_17495/g.42058  ORF Transcript_17495/g.42058 Transcript_17495/m.42058 type:complete len:194 (-) Transcript_17495:107-688(-)
MISSCRVRLTGGRRRSLVKELTILLKWYQIPAKELPKGKAACVARWQEILEKGLQPPTYERWTADDEAKLEEMKEFKFGIEDTALGRRRETSKRQMFSSIAHFSPEEMVRARSMITEFEKARSPQNFSEESPPSSERPSTSPPRSELFQQQKNSNSQLRAYRKVTQNSRERTLDRTASSESNLTQQARTFWRR